MEAILKPIENNVIIKMDKTQESTDGGVILPRFAQDQSKTGVVVAVGSGLRVNGKLITPSIKVGERVLFTRQWGTVLYGCNDADDFYVVRENGILAVIE